MTLRLAIFNHKGGVGKTTLTVNIGAALAEQGYRVLLVDTDPQCNLTAYLVESNVVDDLLDSSDSEDGQTIWSAVKPVSEALGTFRAVQPIETSIAANVFLIPGDIRLSEFEVDLGDFWGECLQRKARGFRGTTAISELVTAISERLDIDFVLYDSGPNIGPLNRAVLLDCDHFVVPVACDLFSLRALKTLGRTLVDWISQWDTIMALAPASTTLLSGQPQFIGYVPEGFRVYGGAPTRDHAAFLVQIDKEIRSQIVSILRDYSQDLVYHGSDYRLGEFKNFGALAPSAQRDGQVLYRTSAGSPQQRDEAEHALIAIATSIIDRTVGPKAKTPEA